MNQIKLILILNVFVISVIVLIGEVVGNNNNNNPVYGVKAIYQFGDSLSDTGNFIRDSPLGAQSNYAKLPYGETFFHHPTGRCSDGLLMIDYFAQHFKLPLLDPYLNKDGDFTHGVNFAVASSTALDVSNLASKSITVHNTNSSLSVQLQWFKSHLTSICKTSDCKDKLRDALFVMGEIGGNDINDAMFQRRGVKEVRELVPEVIQTIKNAVEEIIELGAIRVVVPGNFPFGCTPCYLANFKVDDPNMYDDLKCLKYLNELSNFQNDQLQTAIKELQQKYPHVAIVYADYVYAYRHILRHAKSLGFDENSTVKACCGGGNNTYNFGQHRRCGMKGVPVCPNPQTYVSWDGVHLTSHAYQHMAKHLLQQITQGISHLKTSAGNQPKTSKKLRYISYLFSSLLLNGYSSSFLTEISIGSYAYLTIIVMVIMAFLFFSVGTHKF